MSRNGKTDNRMLTHGACLVDFMDPPLKKIVNSRGIEGKYGL